MTGKVGDRIVVESESVGQPTREGEILEITQGAVGLRYRVRWADGHETVFTPGGGAARIVPAKTPTKAASRTSKAKRAKTAASKAKTAKR
ncbi:MAG TPA: DUF1918 domain-containing protein [Actinomycetota bacterium]